MKSSYLAVMGKIHDAAILCYKWGNYVKSPYLATVGKLRDVATPCDRGETS